MIMGFEGTWWILYLPGCKYVYMTIPLSIVILTARVRTACMNCLNNSYYSWQVLTHFCVALLVCIYACTSTIVVSTQGLKVYFWFVWCGNELWKKLSLVYPLSKTSVIREENLTGVQICVPPAADFTDSIIPMEYMLSTFAVNVTEPCT